MNNRLKLSKCLGLSVTIATLTVAGFAPVLLGPYWLYGDPYLPMVTALGCIWWVGTLIGAVIWAVGRMTE